MVLRHPPVVVLVTEESPNILLYSAYINSQRIAYQRFDTVLKVTTESVNLWYDDYPQNKIDAEIRHDHFEVC